MVLAFLKHLFYVVSDLAIAFKMVVSPKNLTPLASIAVTLVLPAQVFSIAG
jgi:hypothetical protein